MCLWQAISPAALKIHRWSARALVYNDLSGHTHLMDEVTTAVLERLVQGPLSTAALRAQLAAAFALPDDQRLGAWLDQALAQLARLGLIEAAPA